MRHTGNPFKSALLEARPQIGLWLALADAYSAELCAGCGFDWLLVDGEHAPHGLRSTLAVLQAVAAYPSQPVVRIAEGSATLIKQVLELGAMTVMVPMVETEQQARALVHAMRYPPQGGRGVGSGLARSSRWNGIEDYLQHANEHVCLIAQVESSAALANLDEICDVDGIDAVFVGPADLAASLGHLGQPQHPAVVTQVEQALRRIAAHHKPAGVLCADPELAARYIDAGACFVAVGTDTSLLASAGRALARRFASANE